VVHQRRQVGAHRGEVSAIGQPCIRQKQTLSRGTREGHEHAVQERAPMNLVPEGDPLKPHPAYAAKQGVSWERSLSQHPVPPALLPAGLGSEGRSSTVCSQS